MSEQIVLIIPLILCGLLADAFAAAASPPIACFGGTLPSSQPWDDGICSCNEGGKKVDCSSAGLSQLPIGFPTDTTFVDLSSNSDLPPDVANESALHLETGLLSLPKLRKFVARGSGFRSFGKGTGGFAIFRNHARMTNIDLEKNDIQGIEAIDFLNLPYLQELNLKGNKITYIKPESFNSLSSLRVLYLSDNPIKCLPQGVFQGLENVHTIYMKNTDIAVFPIPCKRSGCLSYLTSLNIENGRITDFLWDNMNIHAPKLKHSLKMKKNPSICSWSPLFEEIRCNCAIGRIGGGAGICARGSSVSVWHESVLNGYDESAGGICLPIPSVFACTPEKKSYICDCDIPGSVNCSNRALKEIPAGIPWETTTLSLDHNEISKFNGKEFQNLRKLEVLHLNNNNISTLEPGKVLTGLKITTLHLESNSIASIDKEFFSPVKACLGKLYLQANNFTSFPSLDLTSLEYLDLSFNPSISFLQKKNLISLPALYSLTLTSCGVTRIEGDAFAGSKKLQIIDLSSNNLKSLQPMIFAGAVKLKHLRLRNNNLRILSKGWFPSQNSIWCELDMTGNPSVCTIFGLNSKVCKPSSNYTKPICECGSGLSGQGNDASFCEAMTASTTTIAHTITKQTELKSKAATLTQTANGENMGAYVSTTWSPRAPKTNVNVSFSTKSYDPKNFGSSSGSSSSDNSGVLIGAVVASVLIIALAIAIGVLMKRQRKLAKAPKVITVVNPIASTSSTSKESWRQSIFQENALYGGGDPVSNGEGYYSSIKDLQSLSPGDSNLANTFIDSNHSSHINETYVSSAATENLFDTSDKTLPRGSITSLPDYTLYGEAPEDFSSGSDLSSDDDELTGYVYDGGLSGYGGADGCGWSFSRLIPRPPPRVFTLLNPANSGITAAAIRATAIKGRNLSQAIAITSKLNAREMRRDAQQVTDPIIPEAKPPTNGMASRRILGAAATIASPTNINSPYPPKRMAYVRIVAAACASAKSWSAETTPSDISSISSPEGARNFDNPERSCLATILASEGLEKEYVTLRSPTPGYKGSPLIS
eukprot:UC4_evm2s1581